MNKFRIHLIGREETEEQEISVTSPALNFEDTQQQGGGETGRQGTFWRHRGQWRGHGGGWGRIIRTWTKIAPEPQKERESIQKHFWVQNQKAIRRERGRRVGDWEVLVSKLTQLVKMLSHSSSCFPRHFFHLSPQTMNSASSPNWKSWGIKTEEGLRQRKTCLMRKDWYIPFHNQWNTGE